MRRRSFLKAALGAGALVPLASGGLWARPLHALPFTRSAAAGDRILVLINLNGGNDGLNTLVPVDDQRYYDARKVLGVAKSDTLSIAPGAGLYKVVQEIHDLYSDGTCAIVPNVGYPNQDRSHFRSTDIWNSASNSDQVITTGWTGRYLETIHPEYPATLPAAPFAVQVSSSTTLLLQGTRGGLGMAIDSPDRFFDLASGLSASNDPVPATLAGPQIDFIRRIILEADAYAAEINRAITAGKNRVDYPSGEIAPDRQGLGPQLQGVARLIDGGLPTTIYVVTLGGFDTHYAQSGIHETLLTDFSKSIKAFLADIAAGGNADRVVCMSYSEFGRRLAENNAKGTDHGAAAPQFVFGAPVLGGNLLGPMPDLGDLDSRGDVKMKIDFRQLYSTLLEDWLGFGHDDTVRVLGGSFTKLPLFRTASVESPEQSLSAGGMVRIDALAPSPASSSATLGYTLAGAARVSVTLFAGDGTRIATVLDRDQEAGAYQLPVDVRALPSGNYMVEVSAGRGRAMRWLQVVR
ncbi:MAG: DUF1501 domain-containing protein [Bacteroidetes bacterium]|nr:DUF1501 domain-containing protein [Bacteroidota bacterium]